MSNSIINMLGVEGTFSEVRFSSTNDKLIKSQTFKSKARVFNYYGSPAGITVTVRFDDECGNNHASFAVTADISQRGRWAAGGCCHDEIVQAFPEFAPLIKWHFMNSDGPMHYVSNTSYHASQVKKFQHFVYFTDKKIIGSDTLLALLSDEKLEEFKTKYPNVPIKVKTELTSDSKDRDLIAARSCAIWPEATDKQLCLPKAKLTKLLEKRLPALIEEFKQVIAAIGFQWSE